MTAVELIAQQKETWTPEQRQRYRERLALDALREQNPRIKAYIERLLAVIESD